MSGTSNPVVVTFMPADPASFAELERGYWRAWMSGWRGLTK